MRILPYLWPKTQVSEKKSKVTPKFYHFTYSALIKGPCELEMYDYTRKDPIIREYVDFERDREGDELIHFFALKSVQNATFDNEVFCLVGNSESCRF